MESTAGVMGRKVASEDRPPIDVASPDAQPLG